MIDKATKIFPCECMGEGITVTVEEDEKFFDCVGAPFVGLSFWEIQVKYGDHGGLHLGRWSRVKYAWSILRGHSPWTDQVWMKAKVAQNLANHILYLISKAKAREKLDESKLLVKDERPTDVDQVNAVDGLLIEPPEPDEFKDFHEAGEKKMDETLIEELRATSEEEGELIGGEPQPGQIEVLDPRYSAELDLADEVMGLDDHLSEEHFEENEND